MYQLSRNHPQELKWWARLGSDGRRKDFRRLQKNQTLQAAFDKLLPYIGLWRPLKSSQIERILSLKCPEVGKESRETLQRSPSEDARPLHPRRSQKVVKHIP